MTEIITGMIDSYVFRQTTEGIRFLLLKRNKDKKYKHLWQGVAGKIEPGEKAWETAVRELKEETGLTPKRMFVADHISKLYKPNKDYIYLIPVFGVEVKSKNVILSEEHTDYRWVTLEEALQILVWRGQKEAIRAVYEMVTKNDGRMRWSEIDMQP